MKWNLVYLREMDELVQSFSNLDSSLMSLILYLYIIIKAAKCMQQSLPVYLDNQKSD